MIKLKYFLFSDEDEQKVHDLFNVNSLLDLYNSGHTGGECEITISPNRTKEDNDNNVSDIEKPLFTFTHRTSPENIIRTKGNSPYAGIKKILEEITKQKECNHSYSAPAINEEGDLDPTGIGECTECGFTSKDVLPVSNVRLVRGNHKDYCYISKKDWDKETFIQCGSSGVVLGANPYQTAFFEAFPDVNGLGSFIRGEGKTINEAETAAWEKYQKYLSCPKHEFTREYRGKHRTDGFGVCIHCNFSSSEALEPETKCHKCNKPCSNEVMDQFECEIHYFDRSLDEAIAFEKERQVHFAKKYQKAGFLSHEEQDPKQTEFETYVEYVLLKAALNHLGEEKYLKEQSAIRHLVYQIQGYICRTITGDKRMLSRTYPSTKDSKFTEMLTEIEKRFSDTVESYVFKKEKITFSDLVA